MRLFFALTFDTPQKQAISQYRDVVADNAIKGNFSREVNFHITLAFIGHCHHAQLPALSEALFSLKQTPNHITVEHFGSFKRKGSEMVWLSVVKEPELLALHKQLFTLLTRSGFELEKRKYTPHITVGRNVVMQNPLSELMISPFDIPIRSIALMESKTVGGLLVYEALEEIFLRP